MLEYFFSCTVVGPSHPKPDDEFAPQSNSDFIGVQQLDPECPLFMCNLLGEPAVIQFLSERVQESPAFKDRLQEVVERSKLDPSLSTAAATAFTILVKAGVTYHRHDFRGIRTPGADLSGGRFDSALFQGANLMDVNLGMCWLREADFSNAQMDRVRFGELPYLEEDDCVWACCYSPDGKMLAVGMIAGGLRLYDTQTWKKIRTLIGHKGDVRTVAFSPDSQQLVSGGHDRIVRVWDYSSGERRLAMKGHTDVLQSVAFSPCGKKVASSSMDETVRMWDSLSGDALLLLVGHADHVSSVKFTPDDNSFRAVIFFLPVFVMLWFILPTLNIWVLIALG